MPCLRPSPPRTRRSCDPRGPGACRLLRKEEPASGRGCAYLACGSGVQAAAALSSPHRGRISSRRGRFVSLQSRCKAKAKTSGGGPGPCAPRANAAHGRVLWAGRAVCAPQSRARPAVGPRPLRRAALLSARNTCPRAREPGSRLPAERHSVPGPWTGLDHWKCLDLAWVTGTE